MRYYQLLENGYQEAINCGVPVAYETNGGKKIPGYAYHGYFNYLQGSEHKRLELAKVRDRLLKLNKSEPTTIDDKYKKIIKTGVPAILKHGEKVIQGFIDRAKEFFIYRVAGELKKIPYLKFKNHIELRYGH